MRKAYTISVPRSRGSFVPRRSSFFGSYTQGTATDDSDVDLLVILPFESKPIRKAAEILRKTRPRIPVELLVRTPEQVRTRLALNDYFLHEVMNKGKVLYESPWNLSGKG